MEVETVFKLDKIEFVDKDLIWYQTSYNTGDPLCLCSACGIRVKDSSEFEDPECQEVEDQFPVRLWRKVENIDEEAVIHLSCFRYLMAKGIISITQ